MGGTVAKPFWRGKVIWLRSGGLTVLTAAPPPVIPSKQPRGGVSGSYCSK